MTENTKKLECLSCKEIVKARLTTGAEVYPNRTELVAIPFWRCDGCNNFINCYPKSQTNAKPLKAIPTAQMRQLRRRVQLAIDLLCKTGKYTRQEVFDLISAQLGYAYCIAETRHPAEVRIVLRIIDKL